MKPPLLSAVLVCFSFTLLGIACEKDCEEQVETCPYDNIEKPEQAAESLFFEISSYIQDAPVSIAAGDTLPIELRLDYPDNCYGFTKFAFTETSPFVVDIRAKYLPANCNVCAAVVVSRYFDTSIILRTPGTYTISTYNRDEPRSSIVVEVYKQGEQTGV